ncbi:hypothetical protein Tco_1030676 [Tanacetum coccineum]|uniref:Peptidylprolyl isomerase n=1 Tax=Tanacetum coccineum TaxID=301880 RepID=A0ABQ5G6X2_9ASTR
MRTASAAAKPCQGDSSELYLITGSIYTDTGEYVVMGTVFEQSRDAIDGRMAHTAGQRNKRALRCVRMWRKGKRSTLHKIVKGKSDSGESTTSSAQYHDLAAKKSTILVKYPQSGNLEVLES